ncbi:MAG TPA: PspC domain-containing protein [Bacteroidales bacterium]|mgnify:CR=1 FL=1|nr:PspC domain-containing protein [Bacteroidales bacterium]HPT03240.1 PspC domain-containing protein [Bacteroidales bacterium]
MEKTNRLYRSRTSRVFGGVAGGLAEYFDVDPIIIRLLFLILLLAGGGGLLVYIILWIAIPERPLIPFEDRFNTSGETTKGESSEGAQANPGEPYFPQSRKPYQPGRGGLIGGLVLISLGCIFLADRFIPNINFHDLWPMILVVIGAVLIVTNFTDHKQDKKEQ